MHCLYGLQQMGLSFELKGGTSLSKGLGVIDRFSEDIDIRIEPPAGQEVAVNPNRQRPQHVQSRRDFYVWLAGEIAIDGIATVERDPAFDDERYCRSGGIRLRYDSRIGKLSGIRDGVLLELGFDTVSPNSPYTISSWAYDYAADKAEIKDNRAVDVACYHPGYTFVEKLQTISTKFRKQQESGNAPDEVMRHYYDVYRLLEVPEVQNFIGTDDYTAHKMKRFRTGDNPVLAENEAFILSDPAVRANYSEAYERARPLFYRLCPEFGSIMDALARAMEIEGI